ncbi:MAG: thioesterase domain protein [Phenylobacterium sp.]|nr:thioesterase domain protein [Phenylobacterium sp.]
MREGHNGHEFFPKREAALSQGRNALCAITALLLGLCALGRSAQAEAPPLPPAPGKMIPVESGRRLHLYCQGKGAPTVVFEATSGAPFVEGVPALQRTARVTRACAYDRAGLGWSDPAPPGRSFEERAGDLRQLLRAANVKGPYVLVAGSYGGLIARTFARLYPADTQGMVLVDSAEEAAWFPWVAERGQVNAGTYLQRAALAEQGVLRPALQAQVDTMPMVKRAFRPEVLSWSLDALSRPGHWRAAADEITAVDRTPQAMRRAGGFGGLGERPLIVLSHGVAMHEEGAISEADWAAAQERLTRLSSNSAQVVAVKNTHPIAQENPRLVADAVRIVVSAVRSRRPIDRIAVADLRAEAALDPDPRAP